MSQLILNIKNESIMEKLLWMLEHFKSDGVEVENIVSSSKDYDVEYENSFEYKLDRADFAKMKENI